jgi:hypothetical protein
LVDMRDFDSRAVRRTGSSPVTVALSRVKRDKYAYGITK